MNEDKEIKAINDGGLDDLLRETLTDHRIEPGPALWKGISRKLLWREIAHFNFTNLSYRSWIAGTAGALLIASSLFLLIPDKSSLNPAKPAFPESSAVNTTMTVAPSTGISNPVRIVKTSENTSGSPAVNTPVSSGNRPANLISNSNSANLKSKPSTSAYETRIPSEPSVNNNLNAGSKTADIASAGIIDAASPDIIAAVGRVPQNILEISVLEPKKAGLITCFDPDTVILIHTSSGMSKVIVGKTAAPGFLSAAFEIQPEMSFYSSPETYSKLNVWANAGLSWHFSRFSVSSGLGLGYVYDRNKYRVDFKTNDSVGYFSSVVSYSVGTNNEIVFNTVNKNVYDSLLHTNDYRKMNRYAYIQIPVLFGYRLYESGRFNIELRAGPSVSFLIGERKSEPVIEYPGARIIRVDDHTPSRVTTTWQVWGDLVFDYRLTRKISLYVRPSARYYLNPVAEQENQTFRSPWSAGLGIGIKFSFPPQKKSQ